MARPKRFRAAGVSGFSGREVDDRFGRANGQRRGEIDLTTRAGSRSALLLWREGRAIRRGTPTSVVAGKAYTHCFGIGDLREYPQNSYVSAR
jgi:hypothetical protein